MSDNTAAGPLPVGGPATVDTAGLQLGIAAGTMTAAETARLTPIVGAVNGKVRGWPVASQAGGAEVWPDDIVLGASMLSARLFMRKNSPAGVEVFGDQGAVYVRRNDPDIAMLLGLGAWAPPVVG